MEDNREEPGHTQKKEMDEHIKLQTGEGFFQLFLQISSKIENIIMLRLRRTNNSSYAIKDVLEAQKNSKKFTGNMENN